MKAMILAAGRGERLRPLTDTLPKPLVIVQEKPLIVHHCEKLAAAGFKDVVINLAYLGEQIRAVLGNGQDFGLNITYSLEIDGGLETGGGILQALPLLGPEPFMTINADILTNFDFSALRQPLPPSILANVILISDKNNRPEGDFSLNETLLSNAFPRPYTAAGITIYRSEFFDGLTPGKFSVAPLWRRFADEGRVIGTVFEGKWNEVGNMEQLEKLR